MRTAAKSLRTTLGALTLLGWVAGSACADVVSFSRSVSPAGSQSGGVTSGSQSGTLEATGAPRSSVRLKPREARSGRLASLEMDLRVVSSRRPTAVRGERAGAWGVVVAPESPRTLQVTPAPQRDFRFGSKLYSSVTDTRGSDLDRPATPLPESVLLASAPRPAEERGPLVPSSLALVAPIVLAAVVALRRRVTH